MYLHLHYQIQDQSFHTNTNILDTNKDQRDQLVSHIELKQLDDKNQETILKVELNLPPNSSLHRVYLELPFDFSPNDRILANGFQSWTETKSFKTTETLKAVKKIAQPIVQPFGDYQFYDYPNQAGIIHAWTYACIQKETKANDYLIASLNELSAYTLIIADTNKGQIQIHKDCEGLQKTGNWNAFELYLAKGNEQTLFEQYFQHINTKHQRKKGVEAIFDQPNEGVAGWTSWYHYYTNINETIILDNVDAFQKRNIPIELFQIDDGWQHTVGDWLISNRKFPRGMSYLTDKIHAHGYQAGLWLAPFICEHRSTIFRQHPDWLLKNHQGKLIKASYNFVWKSWMYVLDFYHPEVQIYLQKIFQQVFEVWQFDMVKLDFLYAVAYHPPKDKTRGEVMAEAMQWLRQIIGEKIILGCGVPLAPAFGQVDFCRIGPDVHLSWEMDLLKWVNSRERVSTIMALENTIFRRHLNEQVFLNDPDVSILRSQKNDLTPTQRYTLFFINQLFGNLQFVSDNINQYDKATLQLYQSQFPLRKKEIQQVEEKKACYIIQFSIGDLKYIAYANFAETPFLISHQEEENTLYFNNADSQHYQSLANYIIAPYQTVCFLKIPINIQAMPQLAGSTGHLFPGCDIEEWEQLGKKNVKITRHTKCRNNSTIFIYHSTAKAITINKQSIDLNEQGIGKLRIEVPNLA